MTSKELNLFTGQYQAALFDMDGVLTDTASIHAKAWKIAFDEFLRFHQGEDFAPFDAEIDYRNYVDGKPRNMGVRDFLATRNIALDPGSSTDAPGMSSEWSLANLKNEHFHEVLATQPVEVYSSSIKLVKKLRETNVHTGVVSSSANTAAILQNAGISDLFEVRVDGVSINELGLTGKPAPDTFLEAARLLKVEPAHSIVFEDAIAGVAAGRAGNFGLVVGVNRLDQADALRENGADIVVDDLASFL